VGGGLGEDDAEPFGVARGRVVAIGQDEAVGFAVLAQKVFGRWSVDELDAVGHAAAARLLAQGGFERAGSRDSIDEAGQSLEEGR
jgi:hypothetical protein